MRLSQSASVSSPNGGNSLRLGTRTRKKHKRLDAICEDVFNQNHKEKMEYSEGTTSKGDSLGNDSELRRSSRVRRAPVMLDASPPPKKRRKIDKLGKKSRGKKLRGNGKAKMENGGGSSSGSDGLNDEELDAWRSRLRTRGSKVECSLKGSGGRPRGKKKLFLDIEEDNKDMMSLEDEYIGHKDGETSKVTECTSLGSLAKDKKFHDLHLAEESLENDIEALENENENDCSLSIIEMIDRNEAVFDGGAVQAVEKGNEAPADMPVQEGHNMNDNNKDTGQNDESSHSSKSIMDPEDDRLDAVINLLHNGLADSQQCDERVNAAQTEANNIKPGNEAQVEKHNVVSDGFSKSRIREGRRCGLCGGGIDGKPPKRLANDAACSDHDAYSGSSVSEEFNYDPWDGFGDEPGWLGRLLGPISDRYGIAGVWVHQQCAVWSPEVYFAGLGCLKNVRAALCRGRALKCTRCGRPGATLGCRVDRCPRTYHLPCARASGCIFDHRKFLIACVDHRYLFEPHGLQYVQHIKKLKAKKMKLELKRVSNDASRRDIEAEERWMEKCGEDEEFLRRETKRLQRDLSRIAPVYIGGCHSEGENLFEGWESVAGLQDVIKCMKEVVFMPLLYPEFFENMGITPPRGVLLHGYPGTGKTLVVKALIGSCARGEKRIAYFARKGADCLGKYVGDAERQLRLLFQVAEKCQPSIIFFDEIDGLAPVRTRQQDQTHSSVVSTLLALMDGLKSRGSVIVIGATNRPDAVDPALRRPGRFDREIYFPLPSLKDRASILALHTRKWPKPVAGPLLDWVATKTVGFAGADLQALCAQAAVIALKRNCSWQQILSSAEKNCEGGKRPQLPAFAVEERDWLEALSVAPPPCSRREAGMAASEVVGSPLQINLIPCLFKPLLGLIISLYIDDRLWLPPRLLNAGEAIKSVLVSVMERKGLPSDRWWSNALSMVQESSTAREILRKLSIAGVVDGDASFARSDFLDDAYCDTSRSRPCDVDFNPSGLFKNLYYASSKEAGYRILIAGDAKAGQKHLASCFIHCFVGNIEVQKIDLATISQEGHGDMEQGISHILMKCASVKFCAIYMPRVDLWAIDCAEKEGEASPIGSSSTTCSLMSSQRDHWERSSIPSKFQLRRAAASQNELRSASQTWKSFVEQLECICVSTSLIILATSELPCAALPCEVRLFFGGVSSVSDRLVVSECATPGFAVDVKGEFDQGMLIHSSALDLSRDIVQQFVQFIHHKSHSHSDSNITSGVERDEANHKSLESRAKNNIVKSFVTKALPPFGVRTGKGKSTLALAISTFGYQILTYPHFGELCWATSKLKEGPSADIRGPWKGWPFNSCIVRPCKSMQNEAVCNSNNARGKDKFTLVRGLMAVGLSAYRGKYTTLTEVSLEVRKVLELLVVQIGAMIQSGRGRYQFIRILSQIAYMEDMVNNWSHSLKSLEPDSHTMLMNHKISSEQLSDGLLIPADSPLQLGEKSNIPDNGFHEPELPEGGCQESAVQCLEAASLDNIAEPAQDGTVPAGSSGRISPQNCFYGKFANDENASSDKAVLVNDTPFFINNSDNSVVINQSCAEISSKGKINQSCIGISTESNDTERESLTSGPNVDLAVINEQSQQTNQLACTKSTDQLRNDACNSDETPKIYIHGSQDICNQSSKREMVENVMSAEARMHLSDVHGQPACTKSPYLLWNDTCNSDETPKVEIYGLHDMCSQYNRGKVVENGTSAEARMRMSDVHVQLACTNSPDQLRNDTCNSDGTHNFEIHGSHDIRNQYNEEMLENETSVEAIVHMGYARAQNFNVPFKGADVSLKSEVCAYSCCTGCIHTLIQLMESLITQAWELAGSVGTVEGAHDLVSSLSTTLCSAVRNLYVSGGCSILFNGELRSDACRNLFKHQETSACKCQMAGSKFTELTECACHQAKDFSTESDPSFYDQPASVPRHIFRDGVLIMADPGKEGPFHCKYDTLCLCSLIYLIVMTKQPSN